VGKECGLFEIKKIGDEYFTYFDECKSPKACTIVLRGASKVIYCIKIYIRHNNPILKFIAS
jgi:chaperonin GroEL (HSP60 family)